MAWSSNLNADERGKRALLPLGDSWHRWQCRFYHVLYVLLITIPININAKACFFVPLLWTVCLVYVYCKVLDFCMYFMGIVAFFFLLFSPFLSLSFTLHPLLPYPHIDTIIDGFKLWSRASVHEPRSYLNLFKINLLCLWSRLLPSKTKFSNLDLFMCLSILVKKIKSYPFQGWLSSQA